MARTRHYSDFLSGVAALIGVPTSRITTELAASLNASFNNAIRDVWIAAPWHDTCPKGEARFVGNRLTYPNDLSQTTYWTATAVTVTANNLANPLDGRTTASRLLETVANSAHSAAQTVTSFFPNTSYTVSVYGRPINRDYIQIVVSDGSTTYSAFYNISTGTVGTTSNTTQTQCVQQPNGFYLCQLSFTTGTTTTTSGSCTIKISTDGSTVSYAGDTAKGVYLWGALVQQTSMVPMNDLVIPWEQTGEEIIETVFNVYQTSPSGAMYPRSQGYELTPDGIQIINGTWTSYVNGVVQSSLYGVLVVNPVFLYYRKYAGSYTGSTYSASATYTVGQQIYFTDASSNSNYYKCIVATSAGQSPSTTATSWQLLPIYNPFLQYCIYRTYADWLISDGQSDKASGAMSLADKMLTDAIEVQERQMFRDRGKVRC